MLRRSASQKNRRPSVGTCASSHSPSSERESYCRSTSIEEKATAIGVIGVCALDVKARSKPSRNILNRLICNGEFKVVVFGDKVILDEDIENWPACDFLISFYSDGFPLDKAIAYVKARKPFCVNHVPMQKILWDRRVCLRILDNINVPTAERVEVSRDGGPKVITPEIVNYLHENTNIVLDGLEARNSDQYKVPRKVELIDDGDTLCVDDVYLRKPFVEKPINGEDHNICIYFPKSQGGGARKLFRKIGNKSSEWIEELSVPRAILEPGSSYIYEKFMKVDNAEDVKAYTVGPNFCHAETRKSPVVDGLVRRNNHGKEIRYVTSLTKEESLMASRIAISFGQRVCGFDLLRTEGKSFVIDVNGWSFVKDNDEYYDQCSRILRDMFLREKQRIMDTKLDPTSFPYQKDHYLKKQDSSSSTKDQHRSNLSQQISRPVSQTLTNKSSIRSTTNSSEFSGSTPPRTSPSGRLENNTALISVPPIPMSSPPTTTCNLSGNIPLAANSLSISGNSTNCDKTFVAPPAPKHTWKLKGMVSVIRHADRTPKQKLKFTFHTKPFIELLKGHQEEVLLTGQAALESVTAAVDTALHEGIEDPEKLRNLKNVLVKKGGWIGTKVQIKPMFRRKAANQIKHNTVISKEKLPKLMNSDHEAGEEHIEKFDGPENSVLERYDSLSEVTLSRITAAENSLVLDKLQLIVKWGGEPTHSARYQSKELGESMRNDLILMNREVLDKVHVFSSSERRVTTSAQIWAAAFTHQKEISPDFIKIRKDLLDDSNAAKDEMDKVKKKLKTLLRRGISAPPQFAWPSNMPEPSIVQRCVVKLMKFHRKVMRYNYTKIYSGTSLPLGAIKNPSEKEASKEKPTSGSLNYNSFLQNGTTSGIQARWCCGEDAILFKERWEKLFSEFCNGEKVDPSKISELYDTMKFDALHNRQFLEWVFTPSKSILAEEEDEILEELKEIGKAKQQPRTHEEAVEDQESSLAKTELNRSLHRRMFHRSSMIFGSKNIDEPPEQYFRLFTGSSDTKAKTDARLEKLRELYKLAKVLFDFICPQEYGMTDTEKLEIGLLTSLPLLKEIVQDLEKMQASDEAKSLIYFTKESHIYTLLNCILEGGITTKITRAAIPELDYLSQICFELYESENKNPDYGDGHLEENLPKYEYSIRIAISPGCHTFDPLDVQLDSKHCISCAPRRSLTAHKNWKEVIDTLRAKFHQVKLPKSFLAINLSESHTFHKKREETNQEKQRDNKQGSQPLNSDKSMQSEEKIMEQNKNNLFECGVLESSSEEKNKS
ncbi:hypothetical protein EPUL_005728 [Erysiphe pulchra]|uniref:Inositol hexakisphosphate and diphosphoinositol-pentakisphosphate kinase n=1 Tax=Erysiphe pulchra TaxID=225359 RepID=A0A2S4PNA4_9PEZI|nr:hypothetical protein EPUL_005728 [Erysiphe pulchra]